MLNGTRNVEIDGESYLWTEIAPDLYELAFLDQRPIGRVVRTPAHGRNKEQWKATDAPTGTTMPSMAMRGLITRYWRKQVTDPAPVVSAPVEIPPAAMPEPIVDPPAPVVISPPMPMDWTLEAAVQRMQQNARLQQVLQAEPRLISILEEARCQRNQPGYNRMTTYYALRDRAARFVGFQAVNRKLRDHRQYFAVVSTIDDLLPPDDVDLYPDGPVGASYQIAS